MDEIEFLTVQFQVLRGVTENEVERVVVFSNYIYSCYFIETGTAVADGRATDSAVEIQQFHFSESRIRMMRAVAAATFRSRLASDSMTVVRGCFLA